MAKAGKEGAKDDTVLRLPKTECCVSTSRCQRCPIRLLKEGALPSGYTVHRRKLVKVKASGKPAKKVVSKAELAAAMARSSA